MPLAALADSGGGGGATNHQRQTKGLLREVKKKSESMGEKRGTPRHIHNKRCTGEGPRGWMWNSGRGVQGERNGRRMGVGRTGGEGGHKVGGGGSLQPGSVGAGPLSAVRGHDSWWKDKVGQAARRSA